MCGFKFNDIEPNQKLTDDMSITQREENIGPFLAKEIAIAIKLKYLEIYAPDHSKIFSVDSLIYKKHYLKVLDRYITEFILGATILLSKNGLKL